MKICQAKSGRTTRSVVKLKRLQPPNPLLEKNRYLFLNHFVANRPLMLKGVLGEMVVGSVISKQTENVDQLVDATTSIWGEDVRLGPKGLCPLMRPYPPYRE